eukprot:8069063-Pyramimonas_sp.AAC.1
MAATWGARVDWPDDADDVAAGEHVAVTRLDLDWRPVACHVLLAGQDRICGLAADRLGLNDVLLTGPLRDWERL